MIAFLFTIVYVTLVLLSPADLMPALAPYAPTRWLTMIGLLSTVVTFLTTPGLLRAQQFYLMGGFIGIVSASNLLKGWLGGTWWAFADFLPAAVMFLLVAANVSTLRRFRILTFCLVAVSSYYILRGHWAVQEGDVESPFVLVQRSVAEDETVVSFLRICGQGIVGDPNDFGQLLCFTLPLLGLFYRRGMLPLNFLFIVLPAAWILYGVYLTRSRGTMLGVAIAIFILLTPWLGKTVSALMGGGMLAGMILLNVAGRSISVAGGADRLSLWSEAIGVFKQSPIWGVGYGAFGEYSTLTAHNSFLLVLAELGIIGYVLFWGLFLVPYFQLKRLIVLSGGQWWTEETRRAALLVYASVWSLFVTANFLSRSYQPTAYICLAMPVGLQLMAAERDETYQPFQVQSSWIPKTVGMAVASVGFYYVLVNLR